ncbi:chlorophyllide a oxygenase, chloroplastic [Senna tora]|uniref:Chlorophyllide a oxygenase, chloroplastic n=1 Tax=Senna tora TaxID=362788 RepID=A0A834TG64_9FABA|nr:chlorophyllide a oxygenase, chloroplastic [Senna tora]
MNLGNCELPPSLRPRAALKPLPGGMTALSIPVGGSSTNFPLSPNAPMAPRRVKRMKKRRRGSASPVFMGSFSRPTQAQKEAHHAQMDGEAIMRIIRVCQLRSAMNAIPTAAPLSFSTPSKLHPKKGLRGRFRTLAVFGEELGKKNEWDALFHVEDPRSKVPQYKGKFFDIYQVLEVARYDIQYCDWRARQDVLTIMLLHEKVVEVLNPLVRQYKSIGTVKKELAELQEELAQAHRQVHISEARVATALDKLAYMEELVNDRLLQDRSTTVVDQTSSSPNTCAQSMDVEKRGLPWKSLNVSGPVESYHPCMKNFWYPIAFSSDLKDDTMIPIECFEEPWFIFRGNDGKPGCVQNTCAHRACPLHLGSVNEGRIQCRYHATSFSNENESSDISSSTLQASTIGVDQKICSLCFSSSKFSVGNLLSSIIISGNSTLTVFSITNASSSSLQIPNSILAIGVRSWTSQIGITTSVSANSSTPSLATSASKITASCLSLTFISGWKIGTGVGRIDFVSIVTELIISSDCSSPSAITIGSDIGKITGSRRRSSSCVLHSTSELDFNSVAFISSQS